MADDDAFDLLAGEFDLFTFDLFAFEDLLSLFFLLALLLLFVCLLAEVGGTNAFGASFLLAEKMEAGRGGIVYAGAGGETAAGWGGVDAAAAAAGEAEGEDDAVGVAAGDDVDAAEGVAASVTFVSCG